MASWAASLRFCGTYKTERVHPAHVGSWFRRRTRLLRLRVREFERCSPRLAVVVVEHCRLEGGWRFGGGWRGWRLAALGVDSPLQRGGAQRLRTIRAEVERRLNALCWRGRHGGGTALARPIILVVAEIVDLVCRSTRGSVL
eukprot:scaffold57831_cov72-Phaeocystis_antarctica.AAC.7